MTDPRSNTERFISALLWLAGGILVGLAVSKFSARQAYVWGYDTAKAEITRDAHCLAWWFNDDPRRIREAHFYACQNRKGVGS